jgi:retinol dehydrogenase-12
MFKKNIVITGGTDGIGLALTKQLINKKHNVFIIGKNEAKGNTILKSLRSNNLEFFQCDLSELSEVKKILKTLNNIKDIDVLINNAGAIFDKRSLNSDGIEKTFFLNHLSYFALAIGLVEKLESSNDPRIINVASNAHKRYKIDINDLENKIDYNGWKAYCRSKLLNIFFTYSFKDKLKTKINSNCLHPGFVNSNFGNNNQNFYRFLINILKNLLAIDPDKAALSPFNLAFNDEYKDVNGKYFFKLKEKKSSKESYNIELANQIWNKSLEYLKV